MTIVSAVGCRLKIATLQRALQSQAVLQRHAIRAIHNSPHTLFPTPKKVGAGQILDIVIYGGEVSDQESGNVWLFIVVVNIKKTDLLSIQIVNFSDQAGML